MLVSSILYDTMYDHSSVVRSVVDALVLDDVPKASVTRSEDDASPVKVLNHQYMGLSTHGNTGVTIRVKTLKN